MSRMGVVESEMVQRPQNSRPLEGRPVRFYFLKRESPARGVIWVENNKPQMLSESRRDEMWVFVEIRYPHFVPTGLGKSWVAPYTTHISPLTGLEVLLKRELNSPVLKGSTYLGNLKPHFYAQKSSNVGLPQMYSPSEVGGSEAFAPFRILSSNFHHKNFLFLFLYFLLISCTPHNDLQHIPYTPQYLQAPQPPGFPPMRIPPDNPLSEAGIALGSKLFFDPILSRDSSISCSTCHQPKLAFTDGQALSTGIQGRFSKRSAMSLLNVGFYAKGLFWDGRAANLEEQSLHPVRDTLEMDHRWAVLVKKLQEHPTYPSLFRQAFGIKKSTEIDSTLVGKALAQYERTLISANTKFDQVMRKEATFTPEEKRGWSIFFDASPDLPTSECNHCHVDPLFSTLNFENNGLVDVSSLSDYPDKGRGVITGNPNDNGMFRVPTLRNLKYTAPYMHDGRFKTLDEVLEHYASGGHPGINVSPNVRVLKLSKQDRADLIAFLNTLNDDN